MHCLGPVALPNSNMAAHILAPYGYTSSELPKNLVVGADTKSYSKWALSACAAQIGG